MFVPQHPVTKPAVSKIRESEALVDFAPMLEQAIADTEMILINPFAD